jgi:hypothetical protein
VAQNCVGKAPARGLDRNGTSDFPQAVQGRVRRPPVQRRWELLHSSVCPGREPCDPWPIADPVSFPQMPKLGGSRRRAAPRRCEEQAMAAAAIKLARKLRRRTGLGLSSDSRCPARDRNLADQSFATPFETNVTLQLAADYLVHDPRSEALT